MILDFQSIIDLFFNALSNIMICDKAFIKIEYIKIEADSNNYYNLTLWLQDTEYENTSYHFNISLIKNKNMLKIENIYMLAKLKENTNITPYYYEGLNQLSEALIGVLDGISFYYDEVKQYEK